MDFLRQQVAILQERLAGLDASQKMLTAALAVILVMTMLYWGRFAGTSERVALLPNALQGEELTIVTNALSARGIEHTIDGGRVMVSPDRQLEAFGEVSFAQALPTNAVNALDAMFEKITPFDSSQNFSTRLNSANQQQMAAVLRTWPGVKNAIVIISEGNGSAFSRREPRLSVNITTKGSVDKKKIASSARALAVTCVSGLDAKNTGVTVDGTSFAAGDANGGGASDSIDILRDFEAAESEKIRQRLAWIPGVLVQVTAKVDTSSRSEWRREVDPKTGKIESVTQSKRETSTPMTVGAAAAEPGVVANTSLSAGPASAAPAVATGNAVEKIDENTLVDYNQSNIQINTPANDCKLIGATVGMPRSYLTEVWRRSQPTLDATARPTEEQLKAVAAAQIGAVQEAVRVLTKLDGEAISVGDFFDLDPIVGGPVLAAASPGGAATNLTLLATNHAKEVAVGLLALTSLFMVSRMVKKSAPVLTPVAIAGGSTADEALAALGNHTPRAPTTINGEDIVGEVGDSSPVMFGQELDSEVLETSQMIEQVAGFVKQNPDAAAKMINQWMSRD